MRVLDRDGEPPRPVPALLKAPVAAPVAQMRMRGVVAEEPRPDGPAMRRRKPEVSRGRPE